MKDREKNFYHVKLLELYLLYFRKRLNFSQREIEQILSEIGCDISLIQNESNWFNQAFADRFYEIASRRTGVQDLALQVGEFTAEQLSHDAGGQIIKYLQAPEVIFRNIQRAASLYTRGSHYEPIEVTAGHAIIRSIPEPDCDEQPYQCLNRKGILRNVPNVSGCTHSRIIHEKCLHTGSPYCEYEIFWHIPQRIQSPKIALLLFASCLSFPLLFDHLIPEALSPLSWIQKAVPLRPEHWSALFGSLLVTSLYWIFANRKSLQDSLRKSSDQAKSLETALQESSKRLEETKLLAELSQSMSRLMPLQELCQSSAALIRRKMNYDRVIVWLIDRSHQTIRFAASDGFTETERQSLEHAEFSLNEKNNIGFLTECINKKQSIFIRNVRERIEDLSPRSRDLIQKLGTQAFIATPLIFHDSVLGIITVDNHSANKILTTTDQTLVAAVASSLATSLFNVQSFEELAFLKQNLESEVKAKTSELENKTTALVQSAKFATLGTFASGMTHGILNALNIAVGSLPLIERHLKKVTESEPKVKIEEHLGRVKAGVDYAVGICNHLRTYSGTDKVTSRSIPVQELFDSIFTFVGSAIKEKRVDIEVQIEAGLSVPGNRVGLQEIFLNLISNAIDALKPGGRITALAKTVTLDDSPWCEVRIRDNGSGISEELQKKIFDPFFTTKEVGKGTGLGLSIVQGEVKKHGGRITVDSRLGEGTEFVIHLRKSP